LNELDENISDDMNNIQNVIHLNINSVADLKTKVKCNLYPDARLDLKINKSFKTAYMICSHPDHKQSVGPNLFLRVLDFDNVYLYQIIESFRAPSFHFFSVCLFTL
jgi:hypothetical protein